MNSGVGKETIVNTEKGFEKIEKCGQYVGNVLCYRISLRNGIKLYATGNSRIKILNNDGNIEWRTVDDLQVKDKVLLKINGYKFGKNQNNTFRADVIPQKVLFGTKECIEEYIRNCFKKSVFLFSNDREYLSALQTLLIACGNGTLCSGRYLVIRPLGAIAEYNDSLKEEYDFSFVESVIPEEQTDIYKVSGEFIANNITIRVE